MDTKRRQDRLGAGRQETVAEDSLMILGFVSHLFSFGVLPTLSFVSPSWLPTAHHVSTNHPGQGFDQGRP